MGRRSGPQTSPGSALLPTPLAALRVTQLRLETAVGWSARLVGYLLEPVHIGVEVNALRGAEPHPMLVGDTARQAGGDRTLVNGSLLCVVEREQELGGGIEDVPAVVDSTDQRTVVSVDPDDRQTRSRPIKPDDSVVRLELETPDLIRQDAHDALHRVGVGRVQVVEPEDSTTGVELHRDLCDLADGACRRVEKPQAGDRAFERLTHVDSLGRVVKDDWLDAEARRAGVDRECMVLAARDVHDVNGELVWLLAGIGKGVVGSVRGDRLAPHRQPSGEGAIEGDTAIPSGIDGHRRRGERNESVLGSGCANRNGNWEPAGEREPAQRQVAWNGTGGGDSDWAGGALCGRGLSRLTARKSNQDQHRRPASHRLVPTPAGGGRFSCPACCRRPPRSKSL